MNPDHDAPWAAINVVADKFGAGIAESVRELVRHAEVGGGVRPGRTSEQSDELRRLTRENAELRRAKLDPSRPGPTIDLLGPQVTGVEQPSSDGPGHGWSGVELGVGLVAFDQ